MGGHPGYGRIGEEKKGGGGEMDGCTSRGTDRGGAESGGWISRVRIGEAKGGGGRIKGVGGPPGVRIEEVKVGGRAERDGWTSRVRTDR